jgi:hypothetical protein
LQIASNAPSSPDSVSLTGVGVTGPSVSLSATSLTFASQTVATASAAQTVTVTNTGGANLVIGTATIGGTNAGDFSKSADTCAGATVAPAGTCSVSVRFTPAAAGARSGTLSISSNAAGSPHVVSLSGTGAAPAIPLTTLTTTGNPAFAGRLRVGTTSTALITITNTGTNPLVFNPLIVIGRGPTTSITGPNADQYLVTATTCNTPLIPPRKGNARCTISVAFNPTSVGLKTASLVLRWNGAASPTTLALSATAR